MTIADIESIDLDQHFTADQLDEKRQNRSAYDYLCRLHEVRNWLVACLGEDEIPAAIDLEENFRNGVVLARLANSFAPEHIPLERIFDISQKKYNASGPVYRHTDNIMGWRRAMLRIHFPEIVIPETVDVYEGRNIRTIFCLYALAIHLFRLRKAPAIKNEAGNLRFTHEEIEQIKERLQREGVNVTFSDFGGLLAKGRKPETNKEVLQHINEILDSGDSEMLLEALLNPEGGFIFVERYLANAYLQAFKDFREDSGRDLTGGQIQALIQIVNEKDALARLEQYIQSPTAPDFTKLAEILADLDPEKVIQVAIPAYDELLRDRRAGGSDQLTLEQVHDIVNVCNAIVQVRVSAEQGNADDVYESLRDPALSLEQTLQEAKKRTYYDHLTQVMSDSNVKVGLWTSIRELTRIVREVNDLSSNDIAVRHLKEACENGDQRQLEQCITALHIDGSRPKLLLFYAEAFRKNPPASRNDVQATVTEVNARVDKAINDGLQAIELNNALLRPTERETHQVLRKSLWKDDGLVQPAVMGWYYPSLRRNLKEKRLREKAAENDVEAVNLAESFGDSPIDVVYVSPPDSAQLEKPEKLQSWPLNSAEIKSVIKNVNGQFDEHYRKAENKIRKSQHTIREYLKRKMELAEEMKRERAARTIQDGFRRMKNRGHFGELQSSESPSVDCIRMFIDTLRENDVEEEIREPQALVSLRRTIWDCLEVERTRSKITHLIKSNQKLDEDLTEMDRKIGLLIKNRISLQEVLDHSNKIEADREAFDKRQPSIRRTHSKQALRPFEFLFFHLQAEPVYLAGLFEIETVPPGKLFHDAVFPLFHFASEKREEFLLMRLFAEILSRYIRSLEEPDYFLNGDSRSKRIVEAFSAMFNAFPSHTVVSLSLKPELSEFQHEEARESHFNLRPLEMFEERHQRKADNVNEALSDGHIRGVVEASKEFLSEWANRFTHRIVDALELPKNVQFLLQSCHQELRSQFRQLKPTEVHRLVAKFLFDAYIERSLNDSKLVQRETGEYLNPRQSEILRAVSQMISFAVAGQGFGNDSAYMQSLNDDLIQINNLFTSYTAKHLISRNSTIEIYGLNQYSAFADLARPTLHIQTKHVKAMHTLLIEHKGVVVPDNKSKLRVLIDKAKVPEDETMLLHLRPLPTEDVGENTEGYELFLLTKKLVIDLLLCGCHGSTLPRLLEDAATEEEEAAHRILESADNNNDVKFETLADKKNAVSENLAQLEMLGLVTAADTYQAILNDIAKDILSSGRYREQRKDQLKSLNETLGALDAKRKRYEEQLSKYQLYLDHTLENISLTSRKPTIQVPSNKSQQKLSKRVATRDKVIVVKLSGEKLIKKGIAIVEDKEHGKEVNKSALEISNIPEKPGHFDVLIRHGKKDSAKVPLDFQHLLTASDSAEASFSLDKVVKVHPSALVEYLNRKFHLK